MWSLHGDILFQVATGINSLITDLAQDLKTGGAPLDQLTETAANTLSFEVSRGFVPAAYFYSMRIDNR